MQFKSLVRSVAVGAALLAGVQAAAAQEELNFGIISTESSQNLRTIWEPFLEDMQEQTGFKINAFFAPDYAGIIEGMRFDKVQVAWFGNASAIQAVDRADGEVFAQTVASNGAPGYWALLIVNKDSPIKSFDDLKNSPGKYTFGNGDPNSTSGFLVPSYFAWAENGVDPRTHFTRMLTSNHEANALAVANGQVDVATNNTENMDRLKVTAPEKALLIREIWRSPLIPSDPIVWRKDLPAETKEKVKTFFISYGTERAGVGAGQVAEEKAVLEALGWAPFRESSNAQLIPIRKLALFRDKLKIENDANYSEAEKKAKIEEIDAKLQAIN